MPEPEDQQQNSAPLQLPKGYERYTLAPSVPTRSLRQGDSTSEDPRSWILPKGYEKYNVAPGPSSIPDEPPGPFERFFTSAINSVNPIPAIKHWVERPAEIGKAFDALHVTTIAAKRNPENYIDGKIGSKMKPPAQWKYDLIPEEQAIFDRGMQADIGIPSSLSHTSPPGFENIPRAMQQASEGDLAGSAGTVAGPPLTAATIMGLIKASPGIAAGAKTAAPDVAIGGGKVAVGAALAKSGLLGNQIAEGLTGGGIALRGAKQIATGLKKGFQAGREAMASPAARVSAEPVVVEPEVIPPQRQIEQPPVVTPAPADTSGPTGRVPVPGMGMSPTVEPKPIPATRQIEAAPPPTVVTPAPADTSGPTGWVPRPGMGMPAEPVAEPVPAPVAQPEPTAQSVQTGLTPEPPRAQPSEEVGATRTYKGQKQVLKQVPIDEISGDAGNTINEEQVQKYQREGYTEAPQLTAKDDGGYTIQEGHHRILADVRGGANQIKAWVPADEATASQFPSSTASTEPAMDAMEKQARADAIHDTNRQSSADTMALHMHEKGITTDQLEAFRDDKHAWDLFWNNAGRIPGASKQAHYSPGEITIERTLGKMRKLEAAKNVGTMIQPTPALEESLKRPGVLDAAKAFADALKEGDTAMHQGSPVKVVKIYPDGTVDIEPINKPAKAANQ